MSHSTFFKRSLQRTRAGELSIGPKQSEAGWYRWLENIQDWCISRQLWWGHRCPAYFVQIEGEVVEVRILTISPTLPHLLLNAEKR
jgi:valyl-tRNA synthetase